VKIRAPAKINLRLKVVGRRADGYHLLDTIIVPVSLYDKIEIRRLRRGATPRAVVAAIEIRCDHPEVPLGRENIVHRAAELIMHASGIAEPIAIHIKKSIPVGAGLGGGSSDAAATLRGIDRLFALALSRRRLEQMALALGADVPFFIRSRPARARGIGEILQPFVGPRFWAVIIYPGFPVASAWAYGKMRGKLTKIVADTSIAASPKTFDELPNLLENDLEGVTLKHYPKIAVLKEKLLRAGAPGVLMSGSGSSVFGIFASRQAASNVYNKLRQEEGAQAFLVHGLR
jgi:4-diphosphocytidyl-2-C-methyl-D-erythritol kinase